MSTPETRTVYQSRPPELEGGKRSQLYFPDPVMEAVAKASFFKKEIKEFSQGMKGLRSGHAFPICEGKGFIIRTLNSWDWQGKGEVLFVFPLKENQTSSALVISQNRGKFEFWECEDGAIEIKNPERTPKNKLLRKDNVNWWSNKKRVDWEEAKEFLVTRGLWPFKLSTTFNLGES